MFKSFSAQENGFVQKNVNLFKARVAYWFEGNYFKKLKAQNKRYFDTEIYFLL